MRASNGQLLTNFVIGGWFVMSFHDDDDDDDDFKGLYKHISGFREREARATLAEC